MKRIIKVAGFDQLLQAERRVITAFSLSRLLYHIKSGKPFAIMTTWKTYDEKGNLVPDAVNNANMRQLVVDLYSLGLGFEHLKGAWKEQFGVSYEPSFFVIGISKEDATRLGRKYHQQAVLWGQEGDGVYLIYDNGSEEKLEDTPILDANKLGDCWSEWKRRVFTFPKKQDVGVEDKEDSSGDFMFLAPSNMIASQAFYYTLSRALYEKYGKENVESALARIVAGEDAKEVVEDMKKKALVKS